MPNNKYKPLVKKAVELGAIDARLTSTETIVFDPRAHLKCRFGCARWGRYWTCPPNLSITSEQFIDAFDMYEWMIVVKSADPKIGQEVTVAIEKEAMMSYNSMYAFAMVLCVQCEECAFPEPCRYPHLARPSIDAFGVDFGATLEPLNFEVNFDKNGKLLPAWYGFILLD